MFFCGKIVKHGRGKRGIYCSLNCFAAVEGFDKRLATKRKEGKFSLEAFLSRGGAVSDGGRGAELVRTAPDVNVVAIMEAARDIHPLLPSALMLLAAGKTLREAGNAVGVHFANLQKYHKKLAETLKQKHV